MANFQAYMNQANAWLAQAQEDVIAYFKGCSQNELYAWGANGLGFVLIIVGVVLFFI